MQLTEVLEELLLYDSSRGLKQRTIDNKRYRIQKLLDEIGNFDIVHYSLDHLVKFFNTLTLMAQSTRYNFYLDINSLFEFAYQKEYITRNPLHFYKMKRGDQQPFEYFTVSEMKQILKLAKEFANGAAARRIYPSVRIIYSTGVRNGELCRLEKNHLNREKMRLKVIGSKSGRQRYVPVDLGTLKLIEEMVEYREENTSPYVLLNESGTQMSEKLLDRDFRKFTLFIREKGLDLKITPHFLRHTCATHLYNQGMPIPLLREFMGHKNIVVTMHYAKNIYNKIQKYHSLHPILSEGFAGL